MMDLIRRVVIFLATVQIVLVVLVVLIDSLTLILLGAIGGIILSLFVLIGFVLQSEYSLELKKEAEVEEGKSPVIRTVSSPNDD